MSKTCKSEGESGRSRVSSSDIILLKARCGSGVDLEEFVSDLLKGNGGVDADGDWDLHDQDTLLIVIDLVELLRPGESKQVFPLRCVKHELRLVRVKPKRHSNIYKEHFLLIG